MFVKLIFQYTLCSSPYVTQYEQDVNWMDRQLLFSFCCLLTMKSCPNLSTEMDDIFRVVIFSARLNKRTIFNFYSQANQGWDRGYGWQKLNQICFREMFMAVCIRNYPFLVWKIHSRHKFSGKWIHTHGKFNWSYWVIGIWPTLPSHWAIHHLFLIVSLYSKD